MDEQQNQPRKLWPLFLFAIAIGATLFVWKSSFFKKEEKQKSLVISKEELDPRFRGDDTEKSDDAGKIDWKPYKPAERKPAQEKKETPAPLLKTDKEEIIDRRPKGIQTISIIKEAGREIIADEVLVSFPAMTSSVEAKKMESTLGLKLEYYDSVLGMAKFKMPKGYALSQNELKKQIRSQFPQVSAESNVIMEPDGTLPNEWANKPANGKLWYFYNDGTNNDGVTDDGTLDEITMNFTSGVKPELENRDLFKGKNKPTSPWNEWNFNVSCGKIAVMDGGFDTMHEEFGGLDPNNNRYDFTKAKQVTCPAGDSTKFAMHISQIQSSCYGGSTQHKQLLADLMNENNYTTDASSTNIQKRDAAVRAVEKTVFHGHQVASTIVAAGNTGTIGGSPSGAGLCQIKKEKIVPILMGTFVRTIGADGKPKVQYVFNTLDLANAIRAAADAGVRVANGSFGAKIPSLETCSDGNQRASCVVYDASKFARSKNILLVISSGNEGVDNDSPGQLRTPTGLSPFLDNIISIGGLSPDAKKLFNFGRISVNVLSPGEIIFIPALSQDFITTIPGEYSVRTAGSFKPGTGSYASGTSFSAPITTAIAGIIYQKLETKFASAKPLDQFNYARIVKEILKLTADKNSEPGSLCPDSDQVTSGCLNAFRAINYTNNFIKTDRKDIFQTFDETDTNTNPNANPKPLPVFADTDGDGIFEESDNCKAQANLGQEDGDNDGVGNICDNCPTVANPDQKNSDSDPRGDACQPPPDQDNDTVPDASDNCPQNANTNQANADGDQHGDVCDNCPNVANNDQLDSNGDSVGDACTVVNPPPADQDNDTVPDASDNCPQNANTNQANADGDQHGDVCDNCPNVANDDQKDSNLDGRIAGNNIGDACEQAPDQDGDGVPDVRDNCISIPNAGQENSDADTLGDACDNCDTVANQDQADSNLNGRIAGNGIGDACEQPPDRDSDTISDSLDNCPDNANTNQEDQDNDGKGNVCDNCSAIANTNQVNADGDQHGDACDNCRNTANDDQRDSNGNGIGDACEAAPPPPPPDRDGDGITDVSDNCIDRANADQKDDDGDGVGNVCDNCPQAANTNQQDTNNNGIGDVCEAAPDQDQDGFPDNVDNCISRPNPDQKDSDSDGIGDVCDNCPNHSNPLQEDSNGNKIGDACETVGSLTDLDGDGVDNSSDNCKMKPNPDQRDTDNDGLGDVCDNCIKISNKDQADSDADGIGNACTLAPDRDKDGIPDAKDNCPDQVNADQKDSDGNGVGDVCEPARIQQPSSSAAAISTTKQSDDDSGGGFGCGFVDNGKGDMNSGWPIFYLYLLPFFLILRRRLSLARQWRRFR